MSGFLLLSTIMEHDASKNIPVIMMSSNDSISMVFKCMIKGAADFLVKPIRKNELRNLWQHVWRKQLANGGPDVQHTQQNEKITEQEGQKTGVTKAEHLIENVSPKNRVCSEQESDAQSSCTRSEPEAESKHTNNFVEVKHKTRRHFSSDNKSTEENGEAKETEDNNLVPRREGNLSPKRWPFLNDNNCKKVSKGTEVVHIADDQQKHNTQMEVDIVRTTSQGKHDQRFSIPAHQLELSLRRSDYGRSEDQEKNDRRTLNHSTSSAFSLYNCRAASSSGNAADAQPCSTSTTQVELENKNGDLAAPFQDKTDTCPPIRVVPLPVPVGGFTFNGQPFWNSAPVAPLISPNSALPIWSSKASIWQEAATQASSSQQKSQQNDPKDMNSQQIESAEEHKVLPPNANEKHLRIEIPVDERRHFSPLNGESGSSNVMDSCRNAFSSSGCDSSSNRINTPTEQSDAFKGVPENPTMEGAHQLSQREVALNKFRLKRKERCFEKKVRYQSRKLLAQQRPRVKGQFVRQDHSIQGS